VDALKILTEFAGAQLDRLMALSGGTPEAAEVPEAEIETVEAVEVEAAHPAEEAASQEAAPSQPGPAPAPVEEAAHPPEQPMPAPQQVEAPPPPPPAAAGLDLSQLSEEEQKIHKDAKRFAKLLISEIELYNKGKVADGRKNNDLYKRLKTDIDRSRLTYEKRFGKTVAKQYDYFHEELVRSLAASNSESLGSDYPGPSA
ncbi:MAG: hypothetical protein ACM3NO_03005, partial [Deltaproteobacteria bacterium]